MIDDGRAEHARRRLDAAARVIDGLDGAYMTAEDIGTTTADMDLMSRFTRFVVGRSVRERRRRRPLPRHRRDRLPGDAVAGSPATGSDDFDGRRVGVVGLGKVGRRSRPSSRRRRRGDRLRPRARALRALRGRARLRSRRRRRRCSRASLDVLAPCAAGGLIDEALARALDCRVVAGAANNPLTGRGVARHPDGARDPLRARLPGQLRRPDPRVARVVRRGRRRARPS